MRSAFFACSVLIGLGWLSTAVDAYNSIEVRDGGTVVGTVKFEGRAPTRRPLVVDNDEEVCAKTQKLSKILIVDDEGHVKNAVARLTNISKGKAWPQSTFTLDQKECVFIPHVLVAAKSADVEILNGDTILHMVRINADKNPPWNLGQPKFTLKVIKTFDIPEILRVSCDVHSWMSAYIVVAEHPYHAVTDEKGSFSLSEVPPGQYDLEIWHEYLKTATVPVVVKAGEEAQVEIKLQR